MKKFLSLAIDGNEANTHDRVGSNVYAFEIIQALEKLALKESILVTVLLHKPPIADLPQPRKNWRYRVIKPAFLWTQFAEPIHLFLNQNQYDVLLTPSHYAPRNCPIPYICSVMDLAFLRYPKQFQKSALIQLKHWTKYSVKNSAQTIAISQFTKQELIEQYKQQPDKIILAYPSVTPQTSSVQPTMQKKFFNQHGIRKPYFLYLGTLQPRKNIIRLVAAYEQFCRRLSSAQIETKKGHLQLPQLVLAGKIGWLAEPIIDRIKKSAFFEHIILTGFISDAIKPTLYQRAEASFLIGLHEGFGIPALESLQYDCIPIVANTTSLPEVVGEAGILVDPIEIKSIVMGMQSIYQLTARNKAIYRKKGRQQLAKFSWEKSAQIILAALKKIAHEKQ